MFSFSVKKIQSIVDKSDRKYFFLFIPLIIASALLEGVSVGAVVPLITSLIDVTTLKSQLTKFYDVSVYADSAIQFFVIALFGGVFLSKSIYSLLVFYYVEKTYVRMRNSLHERMYKSYLKASILFHAKHNSSELRRNVDEVGTVFQSYFSPLIILVSESAISIVLISMLLYVDYKLSLISCFILCFIVLVVNYFIKPRLNSLGKTRVEVAEKCTRHLNQGFFAVKEIKSQSKEEYFSTKFSENMKKFLDINMMSGLYNLMSSVLVEFLFVFSLLIVLVISIAFYAGGAKEFLPILALFALTSIRIMSSVKKIMLSVNSIAYSRDSVNLVSSEIQALKNNGMWYFENYIDNEEKINTFDKGLQLKDIYFSYPGEDKMSLQSINIEINKGESVGIVGHSGSGKSTLINIILGFLKPVKGEYYIDGKKIDKNVNLSSIIGYVPQQIYILDDSVTNNIALGCLRSEIDKERIKSALKRAHIYEDMLKLKDGLDTRLGENGASLSGGQIQRLGIARALYNNPSIVVFDEATSSLDNQTELAISGEIEKLSAEKTVIQIAHRLSSIRRSEKIIYIENGEVKDIGTFEQLSFNNKSFRALVNAGSIN